MLCLLRILLSQRRIAGRIIGWALQSSSRWCGIWGVRCVREKFRLRRSSLLSPTSLGIDPAVFGLYAQREETRRETCARDRRRVGPQPVRASDYRTLITVAAREAAATEQGAPITKAVIEALEG